MLSYTYFALWVWCLHIVAGNTETFLVSLPADYPIFKYVGDVGAHDYHVLSLNNTNNDKITINPIVSARTVTHYIELQSLKKFESYMVKTCWSAVSPISIHNMDTMIVPPLQDFMGTTSEHPRFFIAFDITQDSYPTIDMLESLINVSVTNVKLGIPVDLYSTIIYILFTCGFVFALERYLNLVARITTI
ncbi:hypothetical protein TPHA_0I01260 [Tetrapisispora phaffii CBS 4417]|uniref:Protein PBN1 n=1 Tax=Tetrapisispora phaffii (strain ATCC 24235 / CBS 4417 / NBRC 1672 / NRRL Y-8282 / UCD 70-5) TaxID=1071381 RepID=G8BXK4_TETPH|nr:hypothetical protein TPHA_0I01260 [Tetrapisispora phaffii CBS 4417]CCE64632.1 hypothetical protein TPHA_0I01260 [Tetrapisispora phaffii CBS 4417]